MQNVRDYAILNRCWRFVALTDNVCLQALVDDEILEQMFRGKNHRLFRNDSFIDEF